MILVICSGLVFSCVVASESKKYANRAVEALIFTSRRYTQLLEEQIAKQDEVIIQLTNQLNKICECEIEKKASSRGGKREKIER